MRARDLIQRLGIHLGRNTTANPSRKSSEAYQLVTNTGAGGAYSAVTAAFELRTPSSRLNACVYLGNDQGVALPSSGPSAWTLDMVAWEQNKDGLWTPGHNIVKALPLPAFYQLPGSMVLMAKGTVTIPNLPGTGLDATNLWAWAEWEPAPGDDIDPAELAQLFGACSFTAQSISSSKTGAASCAAGQVLFDETFPSVVEVATSAVATPPTYGVLEIPVGALPDCPNLRLTVTADCAWLGNVAGIRNGGAIHAYVNASGLDLPTRAFTSGALGDQIANIPAEESDHAYRTYTFVVYPAGSPAYNDFSGPLASASVYLWCPIFFPDFTEGDWDVKNVHVTIETV